jgi:hypothetical protein
MTLIRTREDEHEVSSDADALDTLQVEVQREGASGADVSALVDTILDARREHFGTGIATSHPVVALLTTQPAGPPEVFAGYWQPDGSWRDVDGGPGGVQLADAIRDHLSTGGVLTPGAVLVVTVNFLSFSGESPDPITWTRDDDHREIELPPQPGEADEG